MKKNPNIKNSPIKKIVFISSIISLVILIAIALILANTPVVEPIIVEPQVIKATLKEGEKTEQKLVITNLLKKDITVYPIIIGAVNGEITSQANIPKYGKEKLILLAFVPPESYGTFVGEAQFPTKKGDKGSSLIIIDSETKSITFDATIELAAIPAQNVPGSSIAFIANLYNLRNSDSNNLLLEYSLITSKGRTIMTESEKLATNYGEWTRVSMSKSIRIPDNAAPGKYVLALKLISKDSISAASTVFEVSKTLDPAFLSLCKSKGVSCSLFLVVLMLIAFFIGGYSYHYLAVTLFRKIRSKEKEKYNLEILILVLLAITTSFILYQLITKTGAIKMAIGGYTETLKVLAVLILIMAILGILSKKSRAIATRIRKITKKLESQIEETQKRRQIEAQAKEEEAMKAIKKQELKKNKERKELERKKELEQRLWLEKRKQIESEKKEEDKRKAKAAEKRWEYIREIFTKKYKKEPKREKVIERIERLRARSEKEMKKEESSIKRDIFKK